MTQTQTPEVSSNSNGGDKSTATDTFEKCDDFIGQVGGGQGTEMELGYGSARSCPSEQADDCGVEKPSRSAGVGSSGDLAVSINSCDGVEDDDVAPWVRQIRDDDGVSLLNSLMTWLDDQRAGFRKLDRVFSDLCAAEKSYSSNLAKLQKRKEIVAAVNIIGSTDQTGLLGALGHALRLVSFPGCVHDRQALSAGLQDLASRQAALDSKFVSLRKRVQTVLSNSRSELSNSRSKVASLRLKLKKNSK